MASSRPGIHCDEAELLRRCQAGDVDAFTSLVRRYDGMMRSLVYHLVGSRSTTDDVLQDAYLKAHRSLDRFRGESSFSTWLYRIVRNSAVDQIRSEARRQAVTVADFDEAALMATGFDDPSDRLVARHDLSVALSTLSDDHYAVVALIDGAGYTYDEVGDLLGISPGTVASRLSRARSSLRHSLAVDDTADSLRTSSLHGGID